MSEVPTKATPAQPGTRSRVRLTPLIFWGMWVLVGPLMIMAVVLTAGVLSGSPSFGECLSFGIGAALAVAYGCLLGCATRGYLVSLSHRSGTCAKCGYSLFGLPEPRCPECGTAFEPPGTPNSMDDPPSAATAVNVQDRGRNWMSGVRDKIGGESVPRL